MDYAKQTCTPCRGGAQPASEAEIEAALAQLDSWALAENGKAIEAEWKFKNFAAAHAFVNQVAQIAEAQGHHPDMAFGWGYVRIAMSTHDVGGLHANDFIMAAKIEEVA